MKKQITMMLAAAMGILIFSGCTASKPGDVSTSDTSSADVSSADVTSAADASSADEKTLNIYTAFEDEQITTYLEGFKKENPDVTVNITRDSTGIITAKLLAEKDNPQADVVWGLSAASLLVLDGDNLLEPYAPAGVEKILPEFKDLHRFLSGLALMHGKQPSL